MPKFIADRGPASGGGIGGIVVRGNNLRADVVERVTSAKVSWSTSQVSQLTLRIAEDDKLSLLTSGLFVAGGTEREGSQCDLFDVPMEVAAIEIAPRGVDHELTITARGLGAQRLRRRTGALVVPNTSWTAWARSEAAEVGLEFVGQDSSVLPNIARQAATGESERDESTWDALQRGAKEIGFLCYEDGYTLFFGQPTWLLARALSNPATMREWWWRSNDPTGVLRALPRARRSGDDKANAATLTCSVDTSEDTLLAGMALRLHGVPTFDGDYLIDSVTFDLAASTTVEVQTSTAVDPVVRAATVQRSEALTNGPTVSTGRPAPGTYGGKQVSAEMMGNAVIMFTIARDRGLAMPRAAELAIACAGQESGLVNLNRGDRDSKGLYQQRPSQGWGSVSQIMNPTYSTNKFYDALVRMEPRYATKTPEWEVIANVQRPQKEYRSYYQRWIPMARELVAAMSRTTPAGSPGATTTSAQAVSGTSVQAHAFTALCERQAGDNYVFGAEVRLADPNPNTFDCSELVEWAAYQVGVKIADGSQNQRRACRSFKPLTPAQAAGIRGALLFTSGHVAISRGDGTTIEARGRKYGVVIVPNAAGRFVDAGLIPGMRYA